MEYQKGTRVFDQWEITDEIGQGTYGKVFVVEKNEYGVRTKSALKVLTIPSSVSEIRSALSNGMDEMSVTSYFKSRVENIMRECAVMSTLKSCENIVHFEDYTVLEHHSQAPGVSTNGPENIGWDILIRMELLTDLDSFQMRHSMKESDVIKMAKDILNALIYCKKKGIVHRDIKPANILVSETGVYKLGDFGESRTMDKTIGATKRGTETYMAPEVYQNKPYGSNVDLYSLGLVMYKLMNKNRLPFYPPAGQMIRFTDTEVALKKRMEGENPPVPVDASEGLSAIILRAIAYSKDNRYREASDMIADIHKLEMGSASDFSDDTGKDWNQTADDYTSQRGKEDFSDFKYQDKTVGVFGNRFDNQSSNFSDMDKTFGVFDDMSGMKNNYSTNRDKAAEQEDQGSKSNTYRTATYTSASAGRTTSNTSKKHSNKIFWVIFVFGILCVSVGTLVGISKGDTTSEDITSDHEYSVSAEDMTDDMSENSTAQESGFNVAQTSDDLSEEEVEEESGATQESTEESSLSSEEMDLMNQWSNAVTTFSSYIDNNAVDYDTQDLDQTIESLGSVLKSGAETKAVTYDDTFSASYMVELANMDGQFSVSMGERTDGSRWLSWMAWTEEIVDQVSVIDAVFTDKIHFGMSPEEVFETLGITEEMVQSVERNGTEWKTGDKRVFVQSDEFYSNLSNPSLSIVDSEVGSLKLEFQNFVLHYVSFEKY